MKFKHLLLITLGLVFALMFGSFLIGISLGVLTKENVIKEVDRLYQHRVLTFSIGMFLYLISYAVTKTVIKRVSKEEVFISEGDFGRVSVSLLAVENIVDKVLRRFEITKKYKIDLYVQNKKLQIKIIIKQWAGGNIADLTDEITKALKERLDKVIGLKENVEIVIKVDGIDKKKEGELVLKEEKNKKQFGLKNNKVLNYE